MAPPVATILAAQKVYGGRNVEGWFLTIASTGTRTWTEVTVVNPGVDFDFAKYQEEHWKLVRGQGPYMAGLNGGGASGEIKGEIDPALATPDHEWRMDTPKRPHLWVNAPDGGAWVYFVEFGREYSRSK